MASEARVESQGDKSRGNIRCTFLWATEICRQKPTSNVTLWGSITRESVVLLKAEHSLMAYWQQGYSFLLIFIPSTPSSYPAVVTSPQTSILYWSTNSAYVHSQCAVGAEKHAFVDREALGAVCFNKLHMGEINSPPPSKYFYTQELNSVSYEISKNSADPLYLCTSLYLGFKTLDFYCIFDNTFFMTDWCIPFPGYFGQLCKLPCKPHIICTEIGSYNNNNNLPSSTPLFLTWDKKSWDSFSTIVSILWMHRK